MNGTLRIVNLRQITSKKDGRVSQVATAMEDGPAASLRGVCEFFLPDGMKAEIGKTVAVAITEFRGVYRGVWQLSVRSV